MDRESLLNELKEIVENYLSAHAAVLVELSYIFQDHQNTLRIITDRPDGGITIGECARFNRELGGIIDEKNIISQSYVIEVSSPGLDWPLTLRSDFLRCIGRKVKFFLKEQVNGKIEWDAVISEVTTDEIVGILEDDRSINFALSNIRKGKQLIE